MGVSCSNGDDDGLGERKGEAEGEDEGDRDSEGWLRSFLASSSSL